LSYSIKVREVPHVPFYLTCLISRSAAFLRLGSYSYPTFASRFVTPYIGFLFDFIFLISHSHGSLALPSFDILHCGVSKPRIEGIRKLRVDKDRNPIDAKAIALQERSQTFYSSSVASCCPPLLLNLGAVKRCHDYRMTSTSCWLEVMAVSKSSSSSSGRKHDFPFYVTVDLTDSHVKCANCYWDNYECSKA
jgi:hypothetical protein